jgi:hypothetical protein
VVVEEGAVAAGAHLAAADDVGPAACDTHVTDFKLVIIAFLTTLSGRSHFYCILCQML